MKALSLPPRSMRTRLLPYLCVGTGLCIWVGNAIGSPPTSLGSLPFSANLPVQNIPPKKPTSSFICFRSPRIPGRCHLPLNQAVTLLQYTLLNPFGLVCFSFGGPNIWSRNLGSFGVGSVATPLSPKVIGLQPGEQWAAAGRPS